MRRIDADDASLRLAAANGDERAVAAHGSGYRLRRTRSRELAFDLTAETLAAVVADLRGSIATVGLPPLAVRDSGAQTRRHHVGFLELPATRHTRRRLSALTATSNVVDNVFVMRVPTLFERGA